MIADPRAAEVLHTDKSHNEGLQSVQLPSAGLLLPRTLTLKALEAATGRVDRSARLSKTVPQTRSYLSALKKVPTTASSKQFLSTALGIRLPWSTDQPPNLQALTDAIRQLTGELHPQVRLRNMHPLPISDNSNLGLYLHISLKQNYHARYASAGRVFSVIYTAAVLCDR